MDFFSADPLPWTFCFSCVFYIMDKREHHITNEYTLTILPIMTTYMQVLFFNFFTQLMRRCAGRQLKQIYSVG